MKKLLALMLALVLLGSCAQASSLEDFLNLLQGTSPTSTPTNSEQYPFSAYDLLKYAATSEIGRMDSCIIETRADPAMSQVIWLCYDESDVSLWLRGTNPDGRQEYTRWEFVFQDAGLRFIGLVLADFAAVQGCLPAGYTLRVDWPGGSAATSAQAASARLGEEAGTIAAHASALLPQWPYDYSLPAGPTPPPNPNPDPEKLTLVQVTKEVDCPDCSFGNCSICGGKGYTSFAGERVGCDKDCKHCKGKGKITVTEYEWQYK